MILFRKNPMATIDASRKTREDYPNPFNPVTKICWMLPVGNLQKMKDILGKEVATLIDVYRPSGIYEFEFNANGLSCGV